MAFEVERETVAGGMGLKLKPNAVYKAVVKYRSTGATQIAFAIHTLSYGSLPGGWRQFGAVKGNEWTTAEVSVHHPATAVRIALDVLGPPESSASIASVELFEVVPVSKK
jgi:hypothetical protein